MVGLNDFFEETFHLHKVPLILKRCFYSPQVSAGSLVVFEKENFSLSAKIEEKPLPQRNMHLLQWAQKEYGAVTSFTELKISRNVYIKVGEGKTSKSSKPLYIVNRISLVFIFQLSVSEFTYQCWNMDTTQKHLMARIEKQCVKKKKGTVYREHSLEGLHHTRLSGGRI